MIWPQAGSAVVKGISAQNRFFLLFFRYRPKAPWDWSSVLSARHRLFKNYFSFTDPRAHGIGRRLLSAQNRSLLFIFSLQTYSRPHGIGHRFKCAFVGKRQFWGCGIELVSHCQHHSLRKLQVHPNRSMPPFHYQYHSYH